MPYDVEAKQVDPRPTAVVRRRSDPSQLSRVVPEGCGVVWGFIRSSGLAHTGLNMALYLGPGMDLECGVLVTGPFAGAGEVVCSQTPGGTVATVPHFGPYADLGAAYDAIHDWCAARGHPIGFPFWEVYGHWDDDPSKLRTDVFYLLAGAAGEPVGPREQGRYERPNVLPTRPRPPGRSTGMRPFGRRISVDASEDLAGPGCTKGPVYVKAESRITLL